MVVTFRMMLVGVAALGIALGVAFGIGVALGKGDQPAAQGGLTQQQLQSLLGISGAQAAGTGTTPSGASGRGGLLGNNVTGQITAIEGRTVTLQTLQGSVKVTLAPSTTVNVYGGGSAVNLKVGDSVVVAGTRKDDGSVEATSLSQLPPELQGLSTGSGSGAPQSAGTASP